MSEYKNPKEINTKYSYHSLPFDENFKFPDPEEVYLLTSLIEKISHECGDIAISFKFQVSSGEKTNTRIQYSLYIDHRIFEMIVGYRHAYIDSSLDCADLLYKFREVYYHNKENLEHGMCNIVSIKKDY